MHASHLLRELVKEKVTIWLFNMWRMCGIYVHLFFFFPFPEGIRIHQWAYFWVPQLTLVNCNPLTQATLMQGWNPKTLMNPDIIKSETKKKIFEKLRTLQAYWSLPKHIIPVLHCQNDISGRTCSITRNNLSFDLFNNVVEVRCYLWELWVRSCDIYPMWRFRSYLRQRNPHVTSSKPQLVHNHVESIVLDWFPMPLEMFAHLLNILLQPRILLTPDAFQDTLHQWNIPRFNNDREALPVQNVSKREVIVVGQDHGYAAVVQGVADPGVVDFVAFDVETELAP